MEVITSLADSAPKSGKIPQQMSGVTRGFRDQQGRARFCLGRASQSTSISLLSEYQAGGGKCAILGKALSALLSDACLEFRGFEGLTSERAGFSGWKYRLSR